MTDQEIQQTIQENKGVFKPSEFGIHRDKLKKKIIAEISQFRQWHHIMMQITSGYRTSGSHQYGTAIDFLLWSRWRKEQPDAMYMWRVVTTWPWMGVGIYFDWKDGIGFHVDLCTPEQRQRPLRWLRVEGKYYYQSLENGLFYHKKEDGTYISTSLGEQVNKYSNKFDIKKN